jgi:tetratricopeptide (TPR) repeat protein
MSDKPSLAGPALLLRLEQARRWRAHDRAPAEDYLARHPELSANPEYALEVVYGELLLREEDGETPAVEEFLQRFPQFAAEIRRLFEVHRAVRSACLAAPPDADTDQRDTPPDRSGAAGVAPLAAPPAPAGYEIDAELGRGGAGVVYRARQVRLNRVVALKVVRGGPHAGADELARFRAEAEAQARLQHPHIVQIFEVNEAGGYPYFALEYMDGGSLAQRLGGTPQPAAAAARLVETLARAVHHAHQRGLVHRDLKPANVLLAADGTPKISDFGLAKRLPGPAAPPGEAGPTRTGDVLGTPSYMAPEQAAGKARAAGPAADVYALGAILYEALTGRPPFLGESSVDTLLQVLSQEPVPPRRLQPKVPRDLETICLKCLRKEPARRYASAEALADDLQRFLAQRPIRARPVGGAERLWRWCRRKPAVASLAAALVLALIFAFAGVTSQWLRAEAHSREDEKSLSQALAAVDTYLSAVNEDPRLRAHDLEDLRKQLLQSALPFYQDFVRRRPNDPYLRAQWGQAWVRLAILSAELGSRQEAIGHGEQALAIFERLTRDHPDVADYREELARAHNQLGDLYRLTDQLPRAEQAYAKARDLRKQLADAAPAQARYQSDLAASYANLGNLYCETNRLAQAKEPLQESLRISKGLADAHPGDARHYRYYLATAHLNLGLWYGDTGSLDKLEAHLHQGRDILKDLAGKHPSVSKYQESLVRAYTHLGSLYSDGRKLKQSEDAFTEARKIQEKLSETHPAVLEYRVNLVEIYNNLGNLYKIARRADEAAKFLKKGLAVSEKLVDEHPKVALYQSYLAAGYHNLGVLYYETDKPALAEAPLRKGLDLRARLARDHPKVTDFAFLLGKSHYIVGLWESRWGKPGAAVDSFAEAARTLGGLLKREARHARAKRFLQEAHLKRARILTKLDRHREALADWDGALAVKTGASTDDVRFARAITLVRVGEHAQATAEAHALTGGASAPGPACYNAACVYSLASAAVPGDAKLPPAERDALAEHYAARALELLTRARDAGFFKTAAGLKTLKNDTDLDPLRSRAEFRKLLAQLESPP